MKALLALFARSLRQDVRTKTTYATRAGLVAFTLLNMFSTHASMGWVGAPGLAFFQQVIYLNFGFISLAGLSYFCSAITEEKEEMTLGLLQMTNLNPLSILLGKSTSRLFGALLLLAAQLPFALLAVSFGGITLPQIFAAYCTLAAYVVFLSNLALLSSVICSRTATAALLTGFILGVFLLGKTGPLALLAFFHWVGFLGTDAPGPGLIPVLELWEIVLPSTRFSEVLSTGANVGPVGVQVIGNLALGLVCFLLAWGSFNFFCRDQKDSSPSRGLLARRTSVFRAFGAGRSWKRALIWKDYNFLSGGKVAVFIKLFLYGSGIALAARYGFDNGPRKWLWLGVSTAWSMTGLLFLELALVAARVFRQERRWKTLSSLAMLPITMRRVAYQKLLGGFLGCWPAVFYIAVGLGMVVASNWSNLWRWGTAFGYDQVLDILVGWEVFSGIAFTTALGLFFLHLVAELSLRLKWGALPLSIGITSCCCTFGIPMAFMMVQSLAFVFLAAILSVAVIVLHVRIGSRLEKLAAEE